MAPNHYATFLPDILDSIHDTLDAHAAEKRPVRFFKFDARESAYRIDEALRSQTLGLRE